MLGAVAISYFCAAALVMAIACSGPDVRAKFASAYLMCAWGLSNFIFTTRDPDQALADFSFWDAAAVAVFYAMFLRWRSRWLALLLAALTTQVIFQLYHAAGGQVRHDTIAAFAANEAMYVLQLAAVCIPTIASVLRRLRRRRARGRTKIRPPYEGWEPPENYRERTVRRSAL